MYLEPSHVLRAMNVPFTAIHGSIRLSLSKYTTEQEIDYVNEVLPGIIEKIRSITPYQDELAELKKQKHFVYSFGLPIREALLFLQNNNWKVLWY